MNGIKIECDWIALGKTAKAAMDEWEEGVDYSYYERKCGRCDGTGIEFSIQEGRPGRDFCIECGGTGIEWDNNKMEMNMLDHVAKRLREFFDTAQDDCEDEDC